MKTEEERKNRPATRERIRNLLIGIVMVGLTIALATGMNLYRQRKDTEAQIAARYGQEDGVTALETAAAHSPAPGETIAGGGIVVETGAAAVESREASAETEVAADILSEDGIVFWKGKEYRRNTYIKTILCLGVDRKDVMTEHRELGSAGQADGIFLIAWDTARNQMKILMIPRDTMTEITIVNRDLNRSWKAVDHLTLAYAGGDGKELSCTYMVEAVSNLMKGLPIDHYLAADTAVISQLNDMVGGVTVTVPTEGMEKRDPAFVKGETVTLKGEQAEAFVRYRDITVDNSAIFRMNQQREYIAGFFTQIRKCSRTDSNIVSRMFDQIQDYMVTDMAKSDYLKIALDAINSNSLNSDSFRMLPGLGTATDTYDEFYVNENGLMEVLLELFYREV